VTLAAAPMTIFEALRQSHELQLSLSARLVQTSGDTPERHHLFATLKEELAVHALAEDRHFYIPLMQRDRSTPWSCCMSGM
jgi:hypothetical protein